MSDKLKIMQEKLDLNGEIELLRHHYTELQKRFVDCYRRDGLYWDVYSLHSLLMEVEDELKNDKRF